jgi:CRISPR/Cas system-associated exonuclease Cas4 (RecB family)
MTSALFEAGFKVFGQQTEIVATAGHWKGHIDGIASKGGKSYLVEFKTHNDKSFKDLLKKQVKASKPTHYAQMTAYMGYLGLKQALYMAYNKNDSEYYIEIVKFDEEYFDDLRRKEQEIIASDALLPRIGNNSPAWFECKMCDAREVCFGRETIEETCRTCIHVDVERGGVWRCTYPDNLSETHFLSAEQQEVACASYELNEMFDD